MQIRVRLGETEQVYEAIRFSTHHNLVVLTLKDGKTATFNSQQVEIECPSRGR